MMNLQWVRANLMVNIFICNKLIIHLTVYQLFYTILHNYIYIYIANTYISYMHIYIYVHIYICKYMHISIYLYYLPLDLQKKTALQRCPRGNGWKQSEIAPSLGKKDMFLHKFQTFFMNICNICYKTTSFFWTINWTNSIYGRLIQCKPVQTMTLKSFGATLLHVHCTNYCILTLVSNISYNVGPPR